MKNNRIIAVASFLVFGLTISAYAGSFQRSEDGTRYINDDGSYAINTQITDTVGYTYRFDQNGLMVTGWWTPAESSGIWYYYCPAENGLGLPEGVLAWDSDIDGYHVGGDGVYKDVEVLSAASAQAATQLLNEIGWDLSAAFNWSVQMPYTWLYSRPETGVDFFAEYGFLNNTGNCYVMAATFCKMARLMGYDCRQMYGSVPSKEGKLIPHSWCEIMINGETRVFDPDYTHETGRNGFNFAYGTSGTWRYQDYNVMSD